MSFTRTRETFTKTKTVIDRKLLILATGRSGTLYVSKVFRKAGMDLGHEAVGQYGTCSMYFIPPRTDVSSINDGQKVKIHYQEDRSQFQFEHVWHQVRDPLKTIDSLAKSFTLKVRRWTAAYCGAQLPGTSGISRATLEDKLQWAMWYWIKGNLMAQTQARWTYRLEELPWKEMMRRLDEPPQPLPKVGVTTNRGLRFAFKSREASEEVRRTMYDTTWGLLRRIDRPLADVCAAMAAGYGYPVG